MTSTEIKYLTRPEAAAWLTANGYPITKTYLGKLAHTGDSPIYRIFGNKALYAPSDLLEWAEQRISQPLSNTAQRWGAA